MKSTGRISPGARFLRALLLLALSLGLSACAGFTSYREQTQPMLEMLAAGQPEQAAQRASILSETGLLPKLEQGTALQLAGQFSESNKQWREADVAVRAWEDGARDRLGQVGAGIASVVLNDKFHSYDGQDFERVMLASMLATNYAMQGDWENARVEIRKTHEREVLIARYREEERAQLQRAAQRRGRTVKLEDLQGYPVEVLNAPEVLALRNGYENAFSHYLAGFVYEALGETSLAAPGYRSAIELRPNVPGLRQSLAGLEQRVRTQANSPARTEVLLVVASGLVPGRVSRQVAFPISNDGLGMISFPELVNDLPGVLPSKIRIDGTSSPVLMMADFDLLARRSLRDEVPGILLRTVLRVAAKRVAAKQAEEQGGELAGALVTLFNLVTEQADERSWRSLPGQIGIARLSLPPGVHQLSWPGGQAEVQVGGRYQLLWLRLLDQQSYVLGNQPTAANPALAEGEGQ